MKTDPNTHKTITTVYDLIRTLAQYPADAELSLVVDTWLDRTQSMVEHTVPFVPAHRYDRSDNRLELCIGNVEDLTATEDEEHE